MRKMLAMPHEFLQKYSPQVRDEIIRVYALPVNQHILLRLQDELPEKYTYHTLLHALDVCAEVIYFSLTDGLSQIDRELLSIAACYHDSGFLSGPASHESLGAAWAREAMKKAGAYDERQILTVEDMILDTNIGESSGLYGEGLRLVMSKYLLDADLSNLGREDFFDKLSLVEKEVGTEQKLECRALLARHKWLTPAATKLREKKKLDNIKLLEKLLADKK